MFYTYIVIMYKTYYKTWILYCYVFIKPNWNIRKGKVNFPEILIFRMTVMLMLIIGKLTGSAADYSLQSLWLYVEALDN